MKYLSVCSGIEAATVAWHPLGWTPVGFSEIEPFCCSLLKQRFPNVPNYGDMKNYEAWKPEKFDLLVGGTPCQSFSVAGLRGGLKDPRGSLMYDFINIAKCHRPKWVVWENVPGVLSSNGGRDFGSLVGALGDLGYGWAYRVLDAQWIRSHGHSRAVPQRRRRVFVVGCLGEGTSAAKVLFESQSVCRNYHKSGAKGEASAADVEGCVASVSSKWAKRTGGPSGDECYNLTLFTKSRRAQSIHDHETWVSGETAPTQNQFDVGDIRTTTLAVNDVGVRRLTPIECERLQGFPDGWTDIIHRGKAATDGPRYKALGNSMAVNCMEWLGTRISECE